VEAVALRRSLLAYYRKHARDLPWRRTSDPYAIWISEVMLQQTQVQTVVPRFAEFLRRFPTVAALAAAEEATVCEAWAGLGYYRRARNLHKGARQIVAQHAGTMPRTEAALRTLAGIGRYTAAAVASIAFGEPVAAVDGNLIRVLARVFALPGRASDARLVERVREHAQRLVDGPHPGEINQALMDVGATLCRPTAPLCNDCPIRKQCAGRQSGSPTDYPAEKARATRQVLCMAFAWIECDGGIVLEQRSLDGLWAGLWELPSASGAEAKRSLAQRLGRPLGARVATVTHDLTHRRVEAIVYRAKPSDRLGRVWADPLAAPLSALARKAIVASKAPRPRPEQQS
jgi:A/G-specific adenine glycosylase